jgi:16S rRNA (uracil1498-N3)-methyltransferase
VTRFHVRPEAVTGDRVTFDAEETHHLARVLRLRAGALVQAVDGQGHELTVRLLRVETRAAEGRIVSRGARRVESPLDLTLVQGIVKGDKLETIIRMATEVGVWRVQPLVAGRSVPRIEDARASSRALRWQRVAKEAAKQSGRTVIPEVARPLSLDEWIAEPRERGLLACLWERAETPLAAILPDSPIRRATLIVGPEGGLMDAEVLRLRSAGALIGGLGPRILRADTAGPIGLALLQFRYGDLGAARPTKHSEVGPS